MRGGRIIPLRRPLQHDRCGHRRGTTFLSVREVTVWIDSCAVELVVGGVCVSLIACVLGFAGFGFGLLLFAELGEPEFGAGFVADVHGLAELAL